MIATKYFIIGISILLATLPADASAVTYQHPQHLQAIYRELIEQQIHPYLMNNYKNVHHEGFDLRKINEVLGNEVQRKHGNLPEQHRHVATQRMQLNSSEKKNQETKRKQEQIENIPYDISETQVSYMVSLDLPGCTIDNVKVVLEEGGETLLIEGRRPAIGAKPVSNLMRQQFSLSRDVNTSDISAVLQYGVLTIELPKIKRKKATVIPISTGSSIELSSIEQNLLAYLSQEALQDDQSNVYYTINDNDIIEENDDSYLDEKYAIELIEEELAEYGREEAPSASSIKNTHVSIAA